MKKSFFLLVPLLIGVSACEFAVGFDSQNHEPGLDKSYPNSNAQQNVNYNYFSGDNIDSIKSNSASLKIDFAFLKESSDAKSDIKDIDLLNEYFGVNQENILTSIEEPNYIGVKDGGLFIGTESSYLLGSIRLNTNSPILAVEIDAMAYFYTTTSFNEEKVIVDDDTAVAVNSSYFIKLSSTAEKNNVCSYRLDEQPTSITIKVGKKRAFINSITLYY